MPMPHKGPRDAIYTKPTIDVGVEIRRDAAKRGISPGDWIARCMAERYGLPATNDVATLPKPQQELPMTG